MADPLGTVASVLAVLKLAVAATAYIKDVKHASPDRLRLREELRSTTCLLEMLKDRIEDSEDALEGDSESLKLPSIAALAGADGPLALFKRILEEIIAKLAPQDRLRRLSQPFKWPFDKKEVAELVSALERLKSHFSLVMQNDLVELAKLSQLKLGDIHQEIENARARSMDKESQRIVLWVSPLAYRPRHLDVLEKAQPGTRAWFLESSTFKRWTKGEIDVLWCPGIPGAGKTILASLIIDKLEREIKSDRIISAYIYCNYNNRAQQTPAALLSSLLQQLLQQQPVNTPLPSEVLSLYQLHKKHDTRPTLRQVTDTLRALTANLTAFHIVVDALDECAESEDDALRFISAVRSLGPSIKLLCTSRFSTMFGGYFEKAETIEISARSEDIRKFLDSQIPQLSSLARHVRVDPTLHDDIVDGIIGESHGMFLLAKLHLDSLSKKINRKAVRAALRTLPATLDATYSEAVQRIYDQAPDLVEVAESVLFWILCAKRPLSVLEIRHVYAVLEIPEGAPLEDDDLPDGDILTNTCGGLILVDAESQTVRIVHYTAQEYFERLRAQDLAAARLSLSSISLTYLTLPNFSSGPCVADSAMEWRLEQYPFLDYASRHWGGDIGKLSTTELETLWPKLQRFVSSQVAVGVASQVLHVPRIRYSDWSQGYPKNVPPLVLAAGFDMPEVLRRLVTAEGHDIESKGSDQVTALIRAAASGLANNVRALLQEGAEIEAQDHMEETALDNAAALGSEDVVKLLIEAGADVNARSPHWTILMTAVSNNNFEVARMLIHAGADVAAETPWGESALTLALRNGQEAIATLLADHGAVLPRTPIGRRASTIASRKGIHDLVRRLTGDYEAVAAKPLQRQNTRAIAGLGGIQEEDEPEDAVSASSAAEPPPAPPKTTEEEDFFDTLQDMSYGVGFNKTYETMGQIGKGHSAVVLECHNRVTGVRTAVKIFQVGKWKGQSPMVRSLQREVELLRKFRDEESHPAFLKMMNVFADYRRRRVLVVTELVRGGELFYYIVKNEKLSQDQTRRIFEQLFSAVEFLHDRGWIHRDIKPENILLADTKSLTIKLADFGLAKEVPDDSGLWHYGATLAGTPSYVTPEILTLDDDGRRKCGTPTDIWSCGVVLYICLCGFPPFSDELKTEVFPYTLSDQIREARFDYPSPYWDPIDDTALDLIDGMLVVDMAERFTARQCLEQPWMVGAAPSIFTETEGAESVRTASPEPVEE